VLALTTLTFIYEPREDRILAAVNAGRADAWSCWITRRLAFALLERAADYLTSTSGLAQRAPAELRDDLVAFEREAAIAKTAKAMSKTPAEVLKSSVTVAATGAELASRVTITKHGDGFRLELHGQADTGAAGVLSRAEYQRILQMLQEVVAKAGWLNALAKSQAAPVADPTQPKPFRH
jgi:hypothetical protein